MEKEKSQQWAICYKKKWWKVTLPFRYLNEQEYPGEISHLEELDLSKLTKLAIEEICKIQLPSRCFTGESLVQAKMNEVRHVVELEPHMKPLSYEEYLETLRYMKDPYKLIVKLLWFANGKIPDGNFVSLQSVLGLMPYDVQFDERVDITSIRFHMSNSRTSHYFGHFLPTKLALEFREYFNQNFRPPFRYIFSDEIGGPLFSQTVSMAIKRAAERADVTRMKKTKGKDVLQPIRALHFRRNFRPVPKK
ncbi:MAG: hypothetical protein K1000chlam2_01562 [Chlamydiae bacterium]|nr:hypothetical protein [Chlamydiota bacterium]